VDQSRTSAKPVQVTQKKVMSSSCDAMTGGLAIPWLAMLGPSQLALSWLISHISPDLVTNHMYMSSNVYEQ